MAIIGSGLNDENRLLEKLAEAKPADVQVIAATQIAYLSQYYEEVLKQAKKSFNSALIAAGIGLIFLLLSVVFAALQLNISSAIISTSCGLIIEFISAINFYLYNRASLQMAEYQERLDRTQRFLIANSICEGLETDARQKARSGLIDVIAKTTYSPQYFKDTQDKPKNKIQGAPNGSKK